MTKLSHLLVELFRNIYRHPGTTASSFLSLTLMFLLFDLFWVSALTSEQFYQDLLRDIEMEVIVSEDFPDSSITQLESEVFTTEGIGQIKYVFRNEARETLRQMVGTDLLAGYDDINPLPRSFLLKFLPEYINIKSIKKIESEISQFSGVDTLYFGQQWLIKAESTKSIISKSGFLLGILILLTALISSANNIRFMARTRAVGFAQMRLLGAGELFISLPFLLEGFLFGGLSAVAGWVLLHYGKTQVQFNMFQLVFPTIEEQIIFCFLAATLGFISGYLGVRKKSER